MILIWALLVSVFALLIVYLFCRIVYLNSVQNGGNPFPWVLIEIILTPILGSLLYIGFCYYSNYTLHMKALYKYIVILIVAILILIVCSIMLAITYCIHT